ncbi:beta-ketoacyl reductase [Aspergillus affinis]|uniref:beta-ketoacyl reductase n=1 Tax=Aspergillus affinis TaxID=1070780 RepID=UPI0022FEE49C|nr:polyketide synthase [Aspergillus affinis]KAI9040577.1 polyketide synthase [Aspergillus affinis]
MAAGLVRTARWERDHDGINFLMLDIRQRLPDLHEVALNVVNICNRAFTSGALVPRNAEYRLQDRILLTNRLFPASAANESIDSSSRSRSKLMELRQINHPVKVTSNGSHHPNGYFFIEDDQPNSSRRGRSMAIEKRRALQEIIQRITHLLAEKEIQPLLPIVWGFSDLQPALADIRRGISGTSVLEPRATDVIHVWGYEFDSRASYVLVGGLGGIGRSVARWMVTHGARNFIFISRSGASSVAAKNLYTELLGSGCIVSDLTCDVTNKDAVTQAFNSCQKSMPPIKGCLQCSMVPEDSMLSKMTHGQFLSAITPKVQGTIKIASALSASPLDFLIFLSSSAGIIGNRGQANYSAANVFLDAFAASLIHKGYPATPISLGSVLSVGWVAENQDRLPIALSYGAISEPLLHSILEYHMDPRWGAAQIPKTCHTVAGVRSARDFY